MDLNELAEIITREILKNIKEETNKDLVMILGKRSTEVLESAEKLLGKDVKIIFSDDSTDNRIPVRYIVPSISCKTMAELATGMGSDILTREILSLLLAGNQVETFEFEYRKFMETAPFPLYGLYESYEKTLAGYGLKLFEKELPDTLKIRTNLVTENDVFKAKEKGVSAILISEKANITPLAKDSARDLNIRLLKR